MKMSCRFVLLSAASVFFSATVPSLADQGGAGITYVSAKNGNDSNSCSSVSTPCQSLAQALLRVATGGTVLCLDTPNQFSSLQIVSSVTVKCGGAMYGTININLPSSDTKQTVHLYNLTVNEVFSYPNAIVIENRGDVLLQNMIVEGTTAAAVKDIRTTNAGILEIKDTVIHQNSGLGVLIAGAASNTAVLDNVTLSTNTYGIAVASGNRVSISRSTISRNSSAGVEADGGSLVIVDGSTIANNVTGIQSGSAIRLSNNNITFNTTGVNGATGSYGNNRFAGNGSDGTALSPVGGSSTDLAQK